MPTIDEVLVDTPDAPDSGQQLPGGSLGTIAYRDYAIAFLSANVLISGEVRPLRWQISSPDGMGVDPPPSAAAALYDSYGNTVAALGPVELDPSPPALTQILAALITVPAVLAPATYLARIVIGVNATETRIDEQILVVKA